MDLNKSISDVHVNLDVATFIILYRRYKVFLLPVGIILTCIIIFIIILIPQVQGVFNAKEQEKIEMQKLEVLKRNYNLLSSMDKATLDSNFKVLSSALPSNKDFSGIINTLSTKSIKTGVTVGDFQFSVGDITSPTQGTTGFPSMLIALSVNGTPQAILSFMRELYRSMPLVEISNIQENNNFATLTLRFFYKAFPQGAISDEVLITQFSAADNALINNLSSWDNNVSSNLLPLLPAAGSSSAALNVFTGEKASESANPF